MKYLIIIAAAAAAYVYWLWREIKTAPDDPSEKGEKPDGGTV